MMGTIMKPVLAKAQHLKARCSLENSRVDGLTGRLFAANCGDEGGP